MLTKELAKGFVGIAVTIAGFLLPACAEQSAVGTAPSVAVSPTPASPASPSPLSPLVPKPSPEPTTVPNATPLALEQYGSGDLNAIAPGIEDFLNGREGKVGVAVVVPDNGLIYAYNGDQLMSMASVVKVLVMLATLDRAEGEGRPVSEREMALLRPMITMSDNDSTTALWNDLGGAPAVEEYLLETGVADIEPNQSDSWGASRASARAVAGLFASLAFTDLLSPDYRGLALDLLSDVVPDQRWGVTAGTPDEPPEGTVIGLKDGWYPASFGWWVNSAGVIIPPDNRSAYAIAVLTRGQPSWEYGIATIEEVAAAVHAGLHLR